MRNSILRVGNFLHSRERPVLVGAIALAALQRFSDGCARALAGRLGGDPCLSTGDTREALPAKAQAQAHQLGRTHLKTTVREQNIQNETPQKTIAAIL
jgi:hypothetical protein